MADVKAEKIVEVELLADGIRLGGVDYVRGDVIKLPEDHAKILEHHHAVGPKGTVDKCDDDAADGVEREARERRILTGLEQVEVTKRRPGRPRKTVEE